jgi:hypothetical protein
LISISRENDKDFYQGYERTPFLQAGSDWVRNLEVKFKKNPRFMKVFLENIDGQSVFISKFLSPIRPPEDVYRQGDNRAIERAARFVSLIPYIEDS